MDWSYKREMLLLFALLIKDKHLRGNKLGLECNKEDIFLVVHKL